MDVRTVDTAGATLFAGTANRALAEAVAVELGCPLAACTTERFADGEVQIRLEESVRDREVFLLQPTSPPVNEHLVELLALADAARRAAAIRISAIVPYFGYARSDRRDGRRAPVMASLVAAFMQTAGIQHVLTLDVHTPAIEGFFQIPVDNLSAASVLAEALRAAVSSDAVIVAPDLGAARLATRYATLLGLPVAICHKRRSGAAQVSISAISGDVEGKAAVIVDDMITTGATIAESARALRAAGARPSFVVAATHAVLMPGAIARLGGAGVERLLVTDSIAPKLAAELQPQVVSVAPLLARALGRLLEGRSLRDLT